MDFLEFHRYEMDALKKSPWELWAERVERILGHNLDGDQEQDGYSLDFALVEFERGLTPAQYAATVLRPKLKPARIQAARQ
jgi:hypothetical protein